ncbi:MAG: amidohydrolase family protein [Pseudobdellovibrionaceae bacterium]
MKYYWSLILPSLFCLQCTSLKSDSEKSSHVTDPTAKSSVAASTKPKNNEATTTANSNLITVADAHVHLVDFLQQTEGIQSLIKAMDQAGVQEAMISGMPLVKKWEVYESRKPLYYLESDSKVYWYSATDPLVAKEVLKLPVQQQKRFFPFISGFNATDRNAIDHIRRMIEWYPDLWAGIGEIMSRHDDLTALTYGETPRADHIALDPIYNLAAELDIPVSIHHNMGSVWLREPIYLGEMENAISRFKKTKFIWCHSGISRRLQIPTLVSDLRRLLKTYNNLWLDISWVVYDEHIAPQGVLNNDWVKLIQDNPNRFIIGSDIVGKFANYNKEIRKYDILFDKLGPAVSQKVARNNFLSLVSKKRARL